MKIIEIGKKKYTVEIDWEALPALVSPRQEMRALAKSRPGLKTGILITGVGGSVVGLIPPNEKIKAPPAALLLSMANRIDNESRRNADESEANWLIVQDLGDGQFWMCVIQDELPLPGSDAVDDWEGVSGRILELLALGGYTVFSSSEQIKTFVENNAQYYSKDVADLIQGIKPKIKFVQLAGIPREAIFGLVLVSLVIGLFFAWNLYSAQMKMQAQKRAQALKMQQLAMEKELKSKAQSDRNSAQMGDAKSRMKAEAVLALQWKPLDVLNAWSLLLNQVPLDHHGWNISSIECSMDGSTPICDVRLKKTSLGTPRNLLELRPDVVFLKEGASYVMRGGELNPRKLDLQMVMSDKMFRVDYISLYDEMSHSGFKTTFEMAHPIKISVPTPVPPPVPGQAFSPPPPPQDIFLGLSTAHMVLSGDGVWQIKELGKYLDENSVALTHLSVKWGDISSLSWKMTGDYWTQNPIVKRGDGAEQDVRGYGEDPKSGPLGAGLPPADQELGPTTKLQ